MLSPTGILQSPAPRAGNTQYRLSLVRFYFHLLLLMPNIARSLFLQTLGFLGLAIIWDLALSSCRNFIVFCS